jgi:hypothetical protein
MRSPADRPWAGSPRAFLVSVSLLLFSSPGAAAPEPPDPAAASSAVVDEVRVAASDVRNQLRTARAQRDVIKTLCLNDKLNQLDVTLRSAGQRREALLGAAAQADSAAVAQEQARLTVHREQARRIAAEARQCIGSPEPPGGEGGPTTMTEPPLPIPADYPPPVDVFTLVQPPLSVSAYK